MPRSIVVLLLCLLLTPFPSGPGGWARAEDDDDDEDENVDPQMKGLADSLRGLIEAIQSKDPKNVAKFLRADGSTGTEVVKAQAERIIACSDLFVAMKKFGLPAAHDITDEFGFVLPGDFFTLLTAQWTIRKDVATGEVEQEDGASLPRLKRGKDDVWQLDLTPSGPASKEQVALVRQHAEAAAEAAEALSAGKIGSADELKAMLRKKQLKPLAAAKAKTWRPSIVVQGEK